jgi:transposase
MKPFVFDGLWDCIRPLLPPPPKRRCFPGRKPLNQRKILTGILFVHKTDIAWDDQPADWDCGCNKACRHYLQHWREFGVWITLHSLLLAELDNGGEIDCERALIDASFAKVPEGGDDASAPSRAVTVKPFLARSRTQPPEGTSSSSCFRSHLCICG